MVTITARPGPTAQPWQNVSGGPQIWPDPPADAASKWPDPPVQQSKQQWPDAPVAKQGQSIQLTNIPADIAATRGKAESIAGQATGVSEAADVLKGKETPEQQQGFFLNALTSLPTEGLGLVAGTVGLSRLAGTKIGKAALAPLERILSPATVSSEAEGAAGAIRSATGTAARDTATTANMMEPFHKYINVLPDADRFTFLNHVENRGAGSTLPPHMTKLDPLADVLRDQFDKRMTKLQALPSTQKMSFIEDYFPHMWQDPNAAAAFANNFGGAGKQGSSASLKARSVPTIADGIAAGLKPVTTDPIEATMRYVRSMDNFIASTEVLDAAKVNGTVKYIRPKVTGASGNPQGYQVPEGWVPIKGRGATSPTGEQAYAPADWARVYNNFISKGFHGNEDAGRVYDALQHGSNAITSLELGLSGYHAFTMANEAIISDVARGISQIVGGKPIKGIGTVGKAAGAPVRSYMTGKKAEQVYLGRTPGTPDLRKIVDLQTQAGGRAVGKGHAPDYRFSAMGNYWTAFKRGQLRQDYMFDPNAKRTLTQDAKEIPKAIGRIMDTVAAPIFEKYIPRIKNGAFYDTMHDWLEMHPNATSDEQVKAARTIWDSIDNRFGELVQDNIFWNKTLKQTAQLAMRSYSWNLGTVREIGGGVRDLARGEWTPKASYVVALPIVVGTANAVYQYLKTGKSPESVEDLVAGRTGGTVPGFGGRGAVDERAMMPGYQKDVLGWYNDWRQEAINKSATGPRMVYEGLMNQDWKGQPIARPDADVPQWLTDYFNWVAQSIGPISIRQLEQGQKTGSNIGNIESATGIRPAPAYLQDPEGYAKGMHAIRERQWKSKETYDKKQQRQYNGTQE
jgi:hypothetical protein